MCRTLQSLKPESGLHAVLCWNDSWAVFKILELLLDISADVSVPVYYVAFCIKWMFSIYINVY